MNTQNKSISEELMDVETKRLKENERGIKDLRKKQIDSEKTSIYPKYLDTQNKASWEEELQALLLELRQVLFDCEDVILTHHQRENATQLTYDLEALIERNFVHKDEVRKKKQNSEFYLTPNQQKVFMYITDYVSRVQYSPTYKEIAKHFSLKSEASVTQYLEALEKKGYIERKGKNRNIVIKKQTPTVLDVIKRLDIKYRTPTHGACCTCQVCGYAYDECECSENGKKIVKLLKSLE